MTAPVRMRLSRKRGFNLQAESLALNGLPAVNVARPSKWGNPFDFRRSEYCWTALSYGCRGDRLGRQEASVRAFRAWIDPGPGKRTLHHEEQPKLVGIGGEVALGPKITASEAPSIEDVQRYLRGHNLACWCPLPKPGQPDHCHGAVLLALANGVPSYRPSEQHDGADPLSHTALNRPGQ